MHTIKVLKMKATRTDQDAAITKDEIYFCTYLEHGERWVNVDGSGNSYDQDMMEEIETVTFKNINSKYTAAYINEELASGEVINQETIENSIEAYCRGAR